MRLKLTLAYDGRPHEGWQSQPGGNTIQDLLAAAASETAKEPLRVHGSGRTDAGVHAEGQVAHLDVPPTLDMNPFNWVPALNTKLPPSIRVLTAEPVPDDFHARFSATAKTYRYQIRTEPVLSPFHAGLAWHLPRQLDPILLEDALAGFQGRHDFEGFSAKRGNEGEHSDFHRALAACRLEQADCGWHIRLTGDGFLYKMARLLVGSAVEVAQGRLRLDEMQRWLDQPPDLPHGRSRFCAPADGLYLESVRY